MLIHCSGSLCLHTWLCGILAIVLASGVTFSRPSHTTSRIFFWLSVIRDVDNLWEWILHLTRLCELTSILVSATTFAIWKSLQRDQWGQCVRDVWLCACQTVFKTCLLRTNMSLDLLTSGGSCFVFARSYSIAYKDGELVNVGWASSLNVLLKQPSCCTLPGLEMTLFRCNVCKQE